MTYRFQFGELFNKELEQFARKYQKVHYKIFREAWKLWKNENNELFQREIQNHTDQGYKGDIEDKMFKSARYYFSKKPNPPQIQEQTKITEKKTPTEPNHYICVNKDLLSSIDAFIEENVKIKPSDMFIKFCQENTDILKKELAFLYDIQNIKTADEIRNKIKKTFKNRYYIYLRKTK